MKYFLFASALVSGLMADPSMSQKDLQSLQIAQEWINKDSKSLAGKDGAVTFLYGATMPTIITAPLRTTDIQLEAGEYITDVQTGDTVRWILSTSVSGPDGEKISHVVVKPTEQALETSLMISTDRRTYHINLISTKSDYMPFVNFNYPADLKMVMQKYKDEIVATKKSKEFEIQPGAKPITGSIDDLSFNYRISGDNPTWKPIRVYNDGIKTYIQMPRGMKFNEAPVLMLLDGSGDKQIVNYRLLEDRFIVDKLFDKAILLLDVGGDQESVVIEKITQTLLESEKNLSVLNSITSAGGRAR